MCSSGGQINDGVTTAGHLICDSGLFYSRVQACWRHNGVCAYTAKLLKKKNTLYWVKGHFLGKQRTYCGQLGKNHY